MGKSAKRFSYLLLDEGEFYVQDWMAICRSGWTHLKNSDFRSFQHCRLKGRLRLCSKSIFFEPDDVNLPIVMFPFSKLIKIEGGVEPLMSPGPVNSKWSRRQEGFVLETTLFVNMKEAGLDAPYVFEKRESRWWFCLEFASVQQFLVQAQSFLSINRLPLSERDMVLSNSMAQREAQGKFDTSRLHDLNEEIVIDTPAAQVTPLVREPGRLVLTQTFLYFQPLHNLNNDSPVRSQPLNTIVTVARRRHALRHIGLEIFFEELDLAPKNIIGSRLTEGGSAFFTFRTVAERDAALSELLRQIRGLENKAANAEPFLEADSPWLKSVTKAWQEGAISNYEYLMYLNLAAGRSFCDLTQWPVMPWILKDYRSISLDLSDPGVFRDLSKPIGALNADRLSIFKERYGQMVEDVGPDQPFLYGTHYSTPGYVLYWLVRAAPAHMLRLQNGRFDAPDRLFVSIEESWDSVINNPADLKELIPEFFSPPADFLLMRGGLNLGVRQGGDIVSDVKLPQWCANAEDFIKKHREALECEHVSKNLHNWIDLIFGFKQNGEAALASDNVFHYLTYEGSVELEAVVDPVQRASYEAQINEFGQAPQQLFFEPHPIRLNVHSKYVQVSEYCGGILHDEVFEGLRSEFLARVMSAALKQDNSSTLLSPKVRSPIALEGSAEFLNDISTSKALDDCNTELNSVTFGAQRRSFKVSRLSSSRNSEEEKFLRLASTRFDYNAWDNWSPASISCLDLKESDSFKFETFHLQEDVEDSIHLARKPAELTPTIFENDSLYDNVVNDLEHKEQVSIPSFKFKEQLSMSQALALHRGPVKAVVLSGENAAETLTLYTVGQDGYVKVFSVQENCQVRATKLGTLPLSCLALAGSYDKYPIIYAGSNDNCLYAYSVDYDRSIGKMRVHEDTVTCVKLVHHSLPRLITASLDSTIKVWTMEEGKGGWMTSSSMNTVSGPACVPETQFLEHEGAVSSFDVEEGGYLVVSGDQDGSIFAWDIRNPNNVVWQKRGVLKGSAVGIQLVRNSPKIVVASEEGTIHLLDARKNGSSLTRYDSGTDIKCIAITDDTLLAGCVDGSLYTTLIQPDLSGTIEEEDPFLQDHTEAINCISICPSQNGSFSDMATASDDGSIHLYSVKHL